MKSKQTVWDVPGAAHQNPSESLRHWTEVILCRLDHVHPQFSHSHEELTWWRHVECVSVGSRPLNTSSGFINKLHVELLSALRSTWRAGGWVCAAGGDVALCERDGEQKVVEVWSRQRRLCRTGAALSHYTATYATSSDSSAPRRRQ